MREITQEELKKLLVEELQFLDYICKSNNIRYYLGYGTALGSVRHKGFIPWDDDIDICIYRNDVKKLYKVINESGTSYKMCYVGLDKDYYLPLPKLINTNTVLSQKNQRERAPIGVYIDLFILDNVPTDPRKKAKFYNRLDFLQKCWSYVQHKRVFNHSLRGYIMTLLYRASKMINPRFFALALDKAAGKFRGIETNDIGSMSYTVYGRVKETISKTVFGNGKDGIFESGTYPLPSDIDSYLKNFYTNYMKLPPEDQRVLHHEADIYWKD